MLEVDISMASVLPTSGVLSSSEPDSTLCFIFSQLFGLQANMKMGPLDFPLCVRMP